MSERIAICITTRNRRAALDKSATQHAKHRVEGASYFFVNDAGEPTPYDDYRFTERVGIPKAKNMCLQLAMDWGADHIFLFDDDCYPIADNWHLPYITSGQHHLCYTFTSGYEGMPGWADGRQWGDKLIIHVLGCGCAMYFSRTAIETVGGFDLSYGLGRYEHADLSRRIHNAGLTPHKFMDVVGSDKLFHSMDQAREVKRSFDASEREELGKLNDGYFWSQAGSREFKPYRI